MSLFQKLQSPEKRALKAIEDQKNYGITGKYKKRYSFVLDQKQWMAPGYTTIHKIKGNFDCGLDKINLKSGIHLPLKTTWLEKATDDKLTEEWIHIGGILEEKYQAEEFRRLMRTATGIFNLEVPVHVDFSEFYELSKPAEHFLQIIKCGLRTETVIKDIWIKSENLEMYEDERGIVYE